MKKRYVSGLILCCLHCIALYGITFFNLTPQVIEFHARMDVITDPVTIQTSMQPHTQYIWQTPSAPSCQLIIATQKIDAHRSTRPHRSHPTINKTSPVIPSFSPWQQTVPLLLKPASYERSRMIGNNTIALIQSKNNAFTALLIDKKLRLAALQKYAQQLRNKRTRATSGNPL